MNFETETQISLNIENKLGQLADVSELLSENEIHIHAISTVGDEMRFTCDNANDAIKLLEEKGYQVRQDEVISIRLQDSKGRLASITQKLAQAKINIDYVYATAAVDKSEAKLVLKVSSIPMTTRILSQLELGAA